MAGKKAAVIGGGHGTSVVLSALSGQGYKLSAILSMADDGGSTGKLRDEMGASAVGDIRQCLVALSSNPKAAELFSYRFEADNLKGHSLGNLILSAGELENGDIEHGIDIAKRLLGVDEDILPSTKDKCGLVLDVAGKHVRGVYNIANTDFEGNKPELALEPPAMLADSAREAIADAGAVIIAPGNFYCSIIPALLVNGMAEALNATSAKVIYLCNLVNRKGHTWGFRPGDYIAEARRLAGDIGIDAVIYNTAPIAGECLREGEEPVGPDSPEGKNYKLVGLDIADAEKVESNANDKIAAVRSLVRHDKEKLAVALNDTIGGL